MKPLPQRNDYQRHNIDPSGSFGNEATPPNSSWPLNVEMDYNPHQPLPTRADRGTSRTQLNQYQYLNRPEPMAASFETSMGNTSSRIDMSSNGRSNNMSQYHDVENLDARPGHNSEIRAIRQPREAVDFQSTGNTPTKPEWSAGAIHPPHYHGARNIQRGLVIEDQATSSSTMHEQFNAAQSDRRCLANSTQASVLPSRRYLDQNFAQSEGRPSSSLSPLPTPPGRRLMDPSLAQSEGNMPPVSPELYTPTPVRRNMNRSLSSSYSGGNPASPRDQFATRRTGSADLLARRERLRMERANWRARSGNLLPASLSAARPSFSLNTETPLAEPRPSASLPTPRTSPESNNLHTTTPRGHAELPPVAPCTSTPAPSTSTPASINISPEPRLASMTVATGDELPIAKEHAQMLSLAARQPDVDAEVIQELLDLCKADQEKLQQKLSRALEEADAIDNLDELFAVNDGMCTAIEVGAKALDEAMTRNQKKNPAGEGDGNSIALLVENEDIFSLICMLRAPKEKKIAAALALMRFARDNDDLRNEIRSSGGMNAFLTLFRTKGPSLLKGIASMAVAYILPSFVMASQTSASVSLRIVECLRFLVTSGPIEVNRCSISKTEMLNASFRGVHLLWIHAIQPRLLLEPELSEAKSSTGSPLRTNSSEIFAKARGRRNSGKLAHGEESIELEELTELAVGLIVRLVQASEAVSEEPLDIGYNIVEQVCEVDATRPIVVREGLLVTLVEWVRSKNIEKIRPAASALRYLISINDQYMAGWIHSQVVIEGAITEIVKLLNESVGHDTRAAVAQMLSALCVASHTRAAVIEANCVRYLVGTLYEHTSPASEIMVFHAASALLKLAAGALGRSQALAMKIDKPGSRAPSGKASIITDMLEGWAHGSLAQITLQHTGKLRSVSSEALRILSEDTDSERRTRRQLCDAGVAEALGTALRHIEDSLAPLNEATIAETNSIDPSSEINSSIKDAHEALRGLANILEPLRESSKRLRRKRSVDEDSRTQELLDKGCIGFVKSGGLGTAIWIATLPYAPTLISDDETILSPDRMDLLDETCRLLANLSPLILSETASAEGCAVIASSIYAALHCILARLDHSCGQQYSEDILCLNLNALRGIGALAQCEPLKIQIVDKSLPDLLSLKNLGGERNELSSSANQVLLSLGFTEDEIAVQVAGNDPKLLVDWFCLQRSLILQSMARVELRSKLVEIWRDAYSDVDAQTASKLSRQSSGQSNLSQSDTASDSSEDNCIISGLFENFTRDKDSENTRAALIQQYNNIYVKGDTNLVTSSYDERNDSTSLLKSHLYPLNHVSLEKDWILSHGRSVISPDGELEKSNLGLMPERIEKFLDSCFPSRLLRNQVVPFNDLLAQCSFNFRALMMPQRRYFSFRREGQLLARLCEKQASMSDTDEVHWSLGFTNSSFAGEFVESLVQSLYLCPMVTGLSFAKNAEGVALSGSDMDLDDEVGVLATLAGSLPAWVSYLTFDNVLSDGDFLAFVSVLDNTGKLSYEKRDSSGTFGDGDRSGSDAEESQGNFTFLGVINSPYIVHEAWNEFFSTLGISGTFKRGPTSRPLSSLVSLDLSGNQLGDELAAKVLKLVHEKDSGCNLEQVNLSGNKIGCGACVSEVLRDYAETYRCDQANGRVNLKPGWKSPLHTLYLAQNDLFLGDLAVEILALLNHNVLCLRFLDLSNNGLGDDTYRQLSSSIRKNSSLCHLNLSCNNFSSNLIDAILEDANSSDVRTSLSFFLLENNTPPLKETQRRELGKFLRKSRQKAIVRMIEGKEREKQGAEDYGGHQRLHRNSHRVWEGSNGPDDDTFIISTRRLSSTRSVIPSGPVLDEHEGDNMITVLFSAPLVFSDGSNKLHPFAKLDFDMERELLWQCMKEASRDIELTFDSAHHSRLLATLTKRCTCLHYSGHGHPNFLPFEDGMGGPNWLNVRDIESLLVRDGREAPFKFVFVSACHSGLAGETFASAGVPHVVCCQQEQELKDTAALAFTRSFYLALAVGHTVRESFEQGCKAVRATPNLKDSGNEMKKFVLLPQNGNHDVPVFKAKPIHEWPKQSQNSAIEKVKSSRRISQMRYRSSAVLGAKSSELGTRNMMQEDPSPAAPQLFLGREVDMYYILTALLKMNKRLVNIIGETGIGRSSLACALCHYINERASTITEIHRMYFIKPRNGGRNVSCRSLLRQLIEKLMDARKCDTCVEEDTEVEAMLDIICKSLKNDKAMIIFDRVELLEKSEDAEEFPMILSSLLYDTKQVKVLLTSSSSLGQPSIGGQVEYPYPLGPLNFTDTVRLFGNLCPHLHTPSERSLFVAKLSEDCSDCATLLPGDTNWCKHCIAILSLLGDGVPSKIEKAAYNISKGDLSKLRQGAGTRSLQQNPQEKLQVEYEVSVQKI